VLGLERGVDGGVDRGELRRAFRGLIRPKLLAGDDVDGGPDGAGRIGARVDGAGLDSLREVGNHGVRQLAARGHFQAVVPERGEKRAVIRLARHDGRPGVSAREQGGPEVESQAPLELFRPGGLARVALLTSTGRIFCSKNATASSSPRATGSHVGNNTQARASEQTVAIRSMGRVDLAKEGNAAGVLVAVYRHPCS
jgi:hypothetical protein